MASYLITGVAGFIGSSLARVLLQRGESVRGIDNFSTGKRETIAAILPAIRFWEGDFADPQILRDACAGVDYVMHEAAIPSMPASVADPLGTHRINLTGTLQLLVAARDARVKRVLFASSASVYGESEVQPEREDMLSQPVSPYAVQKLAAELYMKSFYLLYGLETVVLRYFNVYGPHQDPDSQYSGLLAKMCCRMLRGESLEIFGDGEQSRDFVYIDDVVTSNLLAAAAPPQNVAGRIFNIGRGERVTVNQAVTELANLVGFTGETAYRTPKPGDPRHSLADITLACELLMYRPQVAFRQGLERTVEWYRANHCSPAR